MHSTICSNQTSKCLAELTYSMRNNPIPALCILQLTLLYTVLTITLHTALYTTSYFVLYIVLYTVLYIVLYTVL